MASRLVIDGNSVYEIDEDCENGFGKGAGYGKTASARRNSGRKGRAMEVRGKKESGKTERKRDKMEERKTAEKEEKTGEEIKEETAGKK